MTAWFLDVAVVSLVVTAGSVQLQLVAGIVLPRFVLTHFDSQCVISLFCLRLRMNIRKYVREAKKHGRCRILL